MADTIVRAGPTAIGTSNTTLYTCPGSTTALVRVLNVVNNDSADWYFTLGISNTSTALLYFHQSVYNNNIPFHESHADIELAAGDTIVAISNGSSKLIAMLTVIETT